MHFHNVSGRIPKHFRTCKSASVTFAKILILTLMKCFPLVMFLWPMSFCVAQNVQLHYDFRNTLDPSRHATNFPCVTMEYFKAIDTVGTGSFLFIMQADLNGKNNNVGQVFTQVSQ